MVRMAFVIGVVYTFYCLAVNADGFAGVNHRTLIGVHPLSFGDKALTAGSVTAAGMLSSYHDVSLATQVLVIITAIFYNTF